jgi:hypothetical protein
LNIGARSIGEEPETSANAGTSLGNSQQGTGLRKKNYIVSWPLALGQQEPLEWPENFCLRKRCKSGIYKR